MQQNGFDTIDAPTVTGTIVPGAHLKAVEVENGLIERGYQAKMQGSLAEIASDVNKAIWRADAGKTHIFQHISANAGGSDELEYSGDTEKGIMVNARISCVKNTYPIDIGKR